MPDWFERAERLSKTSLLRSKIGQLPSLEAEVLS